MPSAYSDDCKPGMFEKIVRRPMLDMFGVDFYSSSTQREFVELTMANADALRRYAVKRNTSGPVQTYLHGTARTPLLVSRLGVRGCF